MLAGTICLSIFTHTLPKKPYHHVILALTIRVRYELKQGLRYWKLERRVCALLGNINGSSYSNRIRNTITGTGKLERQECNKEEELDEEELEEEEEEDRGGAGDRGGEREGRRRRRRNETEAPTTHDTRHSSSLVGAREGLLTLRVSRERLQPRTTQPSRLRPRSSRARSKAARSRSPVVLASRPH